MAVDPDSDFALDATMTGQPARCVTTPARELVVEYLRLSARAASIDLPLPDGAVLRCVNAHGLAAMRSLRRSPLTAPPVSLVAALPPAPRAARPGGAG